MSMVPQPFIVTLKLDQPSFDYLDRLRQQHFPPKRNLVPAHITLFHALPGDQQQAIAETCQRAAAHTPSFNVTLADVRFLGKGVAVDVASPGLIHLRQELATYWAAWLSPQDQQRYRPHVTLQNKVTPDHARQLYNVLAATWQPLTAHGEGLLLWRYLDGPWELVQTFLFAADRST